MFIPLSARLLFRVCLPIVSWTGPVPCAAAPAGPGTLNRRIGGMPDGIDHLIRETYPNAGVTGLTLSSAFFSNATIDLRGGYEWDLPRDDLGAPDLSPSYGPGFSFSNIDTRADRWNRLLSEKIRGMEIARLFRGDRADARTLSHADGRSRTKITNPKRAPGRWLRISRADRADLDVIGWKTLGMAPHTEQLTLCFIGLLGIAPSVLRRRGQIGGKDSERRRNIDTGNYFIH